MENAGGMRAFNDGIRNLHLHSPRYRLNPMKHRILLGDCAKFCEFAYRQYSGFRRDCQGIFEDSLDFIGAHAILVHLTDDDGRKRRFVWR